MTREAKYNHLSYHFSLVLPRDRFLVSFLSNAKLQTSYTRIENTLTIASKFYLTLKNKSCSHQCQPQCWKDPIDMSNWVIWGFYGWNCVRCDLSEMIKHVLPTSDYMGVMKHDTLVSTAAIVILTRGELSGCREFFTSTACYIVLSKFKNIFNNPSLVLLHLLWTLSREKHVLTTQKHVSKAHVFKCPENILGMFKSSNNQRYELRINDELIYWSQKQIQWNELSARLLP